MLNLDCENSFFFCNANPVSEALWIKRQNKKKSNADDILKDNSFVGRETISKILNKQSNSDNINPQHYKSSSGLETIEVIDAFTEGLNGSEAVCTANILKYVCRWKKKNGVEDLKKARWYINHLISILEGAEV